MRTNRTRTLAGLATTLMAFTLVGVAETAAEAKGTAVISSGSCSASSVWELKAKPDDGRLEVELEVDSDVVGQTWSVRLSDNGQLFFSGSRKTLGPSGSFTVSQRPANRPGTDTIRAIASNTQTGESCRGSVVVG